MGTELTATIDIADLTGEVLREALSRARVIEVRERDRLLGGFLVAAEFERYRDFVRRDVEVCRAGEFPDDVVAALADSVGKFDFGVK